MDTASAIFLTFYHSSKTLSSYHTHTHTHTHTHIHTQHNNSNHFNADRKSKLISSLSIKYKAGMISEPITSGWSPTAPL